MRSPRRTTRALATEAWQVYLNPHDTCFRHGWPRTSEGTLFRRDPCRSGATIL